MNKFKLDTTLIYLILVIVIYLFVSTRISSSDDLMLATLLGLICVKYGEELGKM